MHCELWNVEATSPLATSNYLINYLVYAIITVLYTSQEVHVKTHTLIVKKFKTQTVDKIPESPIKLGLNEHVKDSHQV